MNFLCVLFHVLIFIGAVASQPGVTFDTTIPCWLNLTVPSVNPARNYSYTEDDMETIKTYIQESMIDAVADLPPSERAIKLSELIRSVGRELAFTIVPPVTIGDYHILYDLITRNPREAYPDLVMSEQFINYTLGGFDSLFYICMDDETVPNYSFIIQHSMEYLFLGYARSMARYGDVDLIMDQVAIGLAQAWDEARVAGLTLESIIPDLLAGLIAGAEKLTNTTGIDIDAISAGVATSVLELAGNATDAEVTTKMVQEVTSDLGLDVSEEMVTDAILTLTNFVFGT